jgi:hypothetical protein
MFVDKVSLCHSKHWPISYNILKIIWVPLSSSSNKKMLILCQFFYQEVLVMHTSLKILCDVFPDDLHGSIILRVIQRARIHM